jgi:flagellar protein FlgJ
VVVVCQRSGQLVAGTARRSAIWDRLSDGHYVADAYVSWPHRRPAIAWCSMTATAQVVTALNQRSSASTLHSPLGTVAAGAPLIVRCQLDGETVSGTVRTSAVWDRLSSGAFVSDAFVGWPGGRPAVPWCAMPTPALPPSFITWAAGYARSTQATYRVPASVTIAQAILESGWGRSGLSTEGSAYFGMKCFGSPGLIALGCRPFGTFECEPQCAPTRAEFRVYASPSASFVDHAVQLSSLPRYATAMRYTADPDRFAVEIHRAGYATSPTYARNLITLMRTYDLYRFDRVPAAA